MGMGSMKPKAINRVVSIPIEWIRPNPAQPRREFDMEEIENLAASIVQNGLLQPLTVRKNGEGYELISGERRLRALRYALYEKAPCIVIEVSDRQSAVLALMENLQREDLNYFEEAIALKNLMVEWGISQQELGERLGYAQPTIANKLRLLKLSEPVRQMALAAGLNERQSRALLRIEEGDKIPEIILTIQEKKMNVAQTERYIDEVSTGKSKLEKRRSHPIVKDVRLFLNTINKAICVMNQSGIRASSQKIDADGYITYIVKIPVAQ